MEDNSLQLNSMIIVESKELETTDKFLYSIGEWSY
jgi:hypothetical protein